MNRFDWSGDVFCFCLVGVLTVVAGAVLGWFVAWIWSVM